MEPLSLAVTAAGFLAEHIAGGALQEAGTKLYNKLSQIVQNKLNIEPEYVIGNRPFLETRIEDEVKRDPNFRNDLESVINELQQFKINSNANVYQTTESGVNQQISGNQGTVIGQQTNIGRQNNNNFRKL